MAEDNATNPTVAEDKPPNPTVAEDNATNPTVAEDNATNPTVAEHKPPNPTVAEDNMTNHIMVDENPEDYLRYYSNRYYLMNIALLYFFAFFLRYQTSPGANYTEFALLCWRLYSR